MDWGVIAGLVAGLGSGLFGAWLGPFATQRAEETKLRAAARRQLVEEGRELAIEFIPRPAGPDLWDDPRFVRLRPHLSSEVSRFYTWEGMRDWQKPAPKDDPAALEVWHRQKIDSTEHVSLLNDLTRLERKWKLV